jgi:H+/Cl- antiporter ClcA
MTCITYGTNVPAGLFLPGMILGCCIGQVYAVLLMRMGFLSEDEFENARKALIVIGISGMMAGYTRMTYALAVILMETS